MTDPLLVVIGRLFYAVKLEEQIVIMDSGGLGEDTLCCACPMKLNEHARKVDNAGSLNLMSCFGVDVAGDRAWLCSAWYTIYPYRHRHICHFAVLLM